MAKNRKFSGCREINYYDRFIGTNPDRLAYYTKLVEFMLSSRQNMAPQRLQILLHRSNFSNIDDTGQNGIKCQMMPGRYIFYLKQAKTLGLFKGFVGQSHQGLKLLLTHFIHGVIHIFHDMDSFADDFDPCIRHMRHGHRKICPPHISIAMACMDSS